MAKFEIWTAPGGRRYKRIKAGYQNVDWDPGNYTGNKVGVGIQAGTNMSISAKTLSDWRGHVVSASEMQALTEVEALQIYYNNYWMAILGDQISSQNIANFLADMKSSGGGVANMQKALNDLGENLAVDGHVGAQTLAAINRQSSATESAKLNNAFRKRQIEYYKGVGGEGLKVWLSSLDRDYPTMSEGAERLGVPEAFNNALFLYIGLGLALLALLLIMFLWLKK